jgi:nucleoside phosphorylase
MNVPARITLRAAREIVDVGIVTIKSEELAAVLARLPPEVEARGQTQYNISRFSDDSGREYHAAIVRAWEQGDLPAQSIVHALVTDLAPSVLIIVGIAGGRPEKEFTLGDVIVASRMFDFTVSAANADGTVEFATRGASVHRIAGIIAANLTADTVKYGDWNSEASIGMPRPPVRITKKNLKGSSEWQHKVREALGEYFGKGGRDRQPIVLDGAIGSSSTLMKDPVLFASWLDKSREVKAVDMEIAGAHEAARSVHGDIPVIVIRALSDIVGFKRDKGWTEYGCRSAAAFCNALLRSGVLPLGHDGALEKPISAQQATDLGAREELAKRRLPSRRDTLIEEIRRDTLTGIEFEIPPNSTFRMVSTALAKTDKCAIAFSGFDETEMNAFLTPQTLSTNTTKAALERIRDIIASPPVRRYRVTKRQGLYRLTVVKGDAP